MAIQAVANEPDLSEFLESRPVASSVDFVVNSIKDLLLTKKGPIFMADTTVNFNPTAASMSPE